MNFLSFILSSLENFPKKEDDMQRGQHIDIKTQQIRLNFNKVFDLNSGLILFSEDLLEKTDVKEKEEVQDLTTKVIGEFGKWQFRTSALMALLKLPIAWFQLNIIFMAPPQDFWCAKPKIFHKYSDQKWREICAPVSSIFTRTGKWWPYFKVRP